MLFSLLCLPVPVQAQQQATLNNGPSRAGRLMGTSAAKLVFQPADGKQAIPLRSVQQVVFHAPPVVTDNAAPLRRLTLCGGEQITGEVTEFGATAGDEHVVLIASRNRTRLPRGVLSGIQQPAAAFNLRYDDFERLPAAFSGVPGAILLDKTRHRSGESSLAVQNTPYRMKFTAPALGTLRHGRVELSFFDTGAIESRQAWNIEFSFTATQGSRTLRATLGGGEANYRFLPLDGPQFAEQPLLRSSGWHQLALWFEPERTLALVDDKLLATGPAMAGPLRDVEINRATAQASEAATPSAGTPSAIPTPQRPESIVAWIDDFKLATSVPELPVPAAPDRQDVLFLLSGDALFGEITSLSQSEIWLRGVFGRRQFAWAETRAIAWKRQQPPPAARGIQGLMAQLEFGNRLGTPPDESDVLFGAVQSTSGDELLISHPYLGGLRLPIREMRRVTPEFLGSRWALAPGFRHLGDEVRDDFRVPFPEGNQFVLSWNLDALPRGSLYISLLAAHLEPSGPQTPTGNPFLEDLAQGYLRTELFINDTRVDDLNRYVSQRASPRHPQRIRIPVAPRFFKVGLNTIRLQQRPSRNDLRDFDDFEFSHLALEAEE